MISSQSGSFSSVRIGSHTKGGSVSTATARRFVVGTLRIVEIAVTAWSAVAHMGVNSRVAGPHMGQSRLINASFMGGSSVPNATIRRSVVESLLIVAVAVTAWAAVAQAGPTPTPTATPAATPTATPVAIPTGSVVGWGVDDDGEATPPDAVNGVSGTATDIAAGGEQSAEGSEHSCAIQADTGIVICWGNDIDGQATPPDAVNGVSGTATDITADGIHSCAIQAGTSKAVC